MNCETMDSFRSELSAFILHKREQLSALAEALQSHHYQCLQRAVPSAHGECEEATKRSGTVTERCNDIGLDPDSSSGMSPVPPRDPSPLPAVNATLEGHPLEPEADPMTRLTAIKLRLAKQIENQ